MNNLSNIIANAEVVEVTQINFEDGSDPIRVPTADFDAYTQGVFPFTYAFKDLPEDDYCRLAEVLGVTTSPTFDAIIHSLAEELEAQDQAIDAFMLERAAFDEAVEDNQHLEGVLMHAIQYVEMAKQALAKIGVTVLTDDNSQPYLSVDIPFLVTALTPAS